MKSSHHFKPSPNVTNNRHNYANLRFYSHRLACCNRRSSPESIIGYAGTKLIYLCPEPFNVLIFVDNFNWINELILLLEKTVSYTIGKRLNLLTLLPKPYIMVYIPVLMRLQLIHRKQIPDVF